MKSYATPVWIDLGDGLRYWPEGEAQYIAHYDYSPGRPGRNYMPNGDPGYPDDPAELILHSLERNGVCLPIIDDDDNELLTPDQVENIERQIDDAIAKENAEADADEYRYWVIRAEDV